MHKQQFLTVALAATALGGGWAALALANPGLLHKRGPAGHAIGAPLKLPGQSPTNGSPAVTAATVSPQGGAVGVAGGAVTSLPAQLPDGLVVVSCGIDPNTITLSGFSGGFEGAAPGMEGVPGAFVPVGIDGVPLPPGTTIIPMEPLIPFPPGQNAPGYGGPVHGGFGHGDFGHGGFGDGGFGDGKAPPAGAGHSGGIYHAGEFQGQAQNALMAAPATTPTTTDGASFGSARAGGLPNRAAGVRPGSVLPPRHSPAGGRFGTAPRQSDSAAADSSADGVTVAGGSASNDGGKVRQASAIAAGQVGVPAGAVTAPRWRDRIRFAWPGSSGR